MTPSEILRKAKALIDTPRKWTQEARAKDIYGEVVSPESYSAFYFSSSGALQNTHYRCNKKTIHQEVEYLRKVMGERIDAFNHTHTHREVMAKWDEAIALAEADEREVCDTCNGTGVQCFETSGLAEDGNAPILEPCGMCGYGDERGGV